MKKKKSILNKKMLTQDLQVFALVFLYALQ